MHNDLHIFKKLYNFKTKWGVRNLRLRKCEGETKQSSKPLLVLIYSRIIIPLSIPP